MKKFLVFILVLALLIASEYYFLTELFSQKRVVILSTSLLGIFVCIYALIKFFKKNILSPKHS